MLHLLDPLREMTALSVVVRMFLAVLCGGAIGMERSYKRRPAGLRTHILICLGACLTTMTGQYLALVMHYYTDITRLGAQVIAGVGFIGAGTIIVTRRRRIKGLTTAAGLWTTSIVGLALGATYYEVAISATVLLLIAELMLSTIEYKLLRRIKDIFLYVEYETNDSLDLLVNVLSQHGAEIRDLEISQGEGTCRCAIFTLKCDKQFTQQDISMIAAETGVFLLEEM